MRRVVAAALAGLSVVALADVPPAQTAEVTHLIEFVASSGCTIDRNGSRYPGADAVAHIQNKYDYFRDKIDSTEKFIELAASRSTQSGKDYLVQCGSSPATTTRAWLLAELSRFRAARAGAPGG